MRAIFYHGVVKGRAAQDYYASNFVDVAAFRDQVKALARSWRVVSLAEFAEQLAHPKHLDRRTVHLSFDDGFSNVLTAAEILDDAALPWTLFVITDAVLHGYRPAYIQLADAVSSCNKRIRWGGLEYDLTGTDGKWSFARRAKAALKAAPNGSAAELFAEILNRVGHREPVPAERSHWSFLRPAELSELDRAGVEIGNHSARHLDLVRATDEDLRHEVHDSRLQLESAIGTSVWSFAYPDGGYDDRVRDQVMETHRLAMATTTRRSPRSLSAVRRYPAGRSVEALNDVLSPLYPVASRVRRARRAVSSGLPANRSRSGSSSGARFGRTPS